ncbi:hypothetical protein CC78DRAFT_607321 [Lojkania enalia]|uniref:Glycosyltransferase family 25 protein n=1 Tax=Lojkania enalia TaxID=147567 RepID=A0A9P4N7C0_9PLEO|nr:hypothetical protein CC78DRAFT_607321 [Didymosphaeria enalia]
MEKNKDLRKGYALSWSGYLNTLKVAVAHDTSLILEDDVDWDISICEQTLEMAEAAPILQDSTISQGPSFGMKWDILWLGHCDNSIVFDPPPIVLDDPTEPLYFNSWEKVLSTDPQHKQYVHPSAGPLCTYAYAVTGVMAKKPLDRGGHGSAPFDIWLHMSRIR